MPAYDYRCTSCGDVFEVTRDISDASTIACPTCGASAKRVFTAPGVVFKGSGFHNTDYRPRPAESPPSSDSPSCPASGSAPCAGCPASSGD